MHFIKKHCHYLSAHIKVIKVDKISGGCCYLNVNCRMLRLSTVVQWYDGIFFSIGKLDFFKRPRSCNYDICFI